MFTFKINTHVIRGAKVSTSIVEITLSATNHQSPFIKALHKLEAISQLNSKQYAPIQVLKNSVENLWCELSQYMDISLSEHTKESFEDLLYSIEQFIERKPKSGISKITDWMIIRSLLKLNNEVLGDNTPIVACLNDYSSSIRGEKLHRSISGLELLSSLPHEDIAHLEKKATKITKKILDDIIYGCEKDIEEYLKICRKQNNFGKYKLKEEIKSDIFTYFIDDTNANRLKRHRQIDILKAISLFLEEKEFFHFSKNSGDSLDFTFPSGDSLRILKSFPHYRKARSNQQWIFSRYRLPNYVLCSCYILLIAKTGWNISSVGNLTIKDFKKTLNGSYEIQSPKHKTDDNTPKYLVSKADKYLKICLSLLLWNYDQLIKYKLISGTSDNIWYGWQRDYNQPFFPIDSKKVKAFFLRYNLTPIPLSEIRPIKSSFQFLKSQDIELIRLTLGHSSIETTNSYLKNNIIFHLNEARILEFQRRFETTIANETASPSDFKIRGFFEEKIDPSLMRNIHKNEPSLNKNLIDDARSFLISIGVETQNSSSIITRDVLRQVILLRKYYDLRWKHLYDKNPGFFVKNHLNKILYINVFLRIVKERKPLLIDELMNLKGALS